jgi:hypothetical protein
MAFEKKKPLDKVAQPAMVALLAERIVSNVRGSLTTPRNHGWLRYRRRTTSS